MRRRRVPRNRRKCCRRLVTERPERLDASTLVTRQGRGMWSRDCSTEHGTRDPLLDTTSCMHCCLTTRKFPRLARLIPTPGERNETAQQFSRSRTLETQAVPCSWTPFSATESRHGAHRGGATAAVNGGSHHGLRQRVWSGEPRFVARHGDRRSSGELARHAENTVCLAGITGYQLAPAGDLASLLLVAWSVHVALPPPRGRVWRQVR